MKLFLIFSVVVGVSIAAPSVKENKAMSYGYGAPAKTDPIAEPPAYGAPVETEPKDYGKEEPTYGAPAKKDSAAYEKKEEETSTTPAPAPAAIGRNVTDVTNLDPTAMGLDVRKMMPTLPGYNSKKIEALPKNTPIVYVCLKWYCDQVCVSETNDLRTDFIKTFAKDMVQTLKPTTPGITEEDIVVTNIMAVGEVTAVEFAVLSPGAKALLLEIRRNLNNGQISTGKYVYDPAVFAYVEMGASSVANTEEPANESNSSSSSIPVVAIVGAAAGVILMVGLLGFGGYKYQQSRKNGSAQRKEKLSAMWFHDQEGQAPRISVDDMSMPEYNNRSNAVSGKYSMQTKDTPMVMSQYGEAGNSNAFDDPNILQNMRESVYDFGTN